MNDDILGRISAGVDLSMDEMSTVIDAIMQGNWQEAEIGLLLTSLRAKGETAQEVAGAAAALRKHMVPIRSGRQGLIDTCGTGGDGSGTFNISTAAALVTAAAGVPVAKHGNRRISSKTGSADVLEALGVDVGVSVEVVEACLDELGICFCFAALMHPAMKIVSAVRKKLGVPTIFNLLGPLSNPARAPYQLLGVGRPDLRPLLSEALGLLGTTRSLVVCGEDGLDEVTLNGKTHVTLISAKGSGDGQHERVWTPQDFGLQASTLESMRVEDAQQSAAIIREILVGTPSPARDIVVLNAAAALYTAEVCDQPMECARRAAEAIDSGAARDLLARLAEKTHA